MEEEDGNDYSKKKKKEESTEMRKLPINKEREMHETVTDA